MALQSVDNSQRAQTNASIEALPGAMRPPAAPVRTAAAVIGTGSTAHAIAVRGKVNPAPILIEPWSDSKQNARAPLKRIGGAGSPRIVTDPRLLGSPVLLADYGAWSNDYDAFHKPGSAAGVYSDLATIIYDHEIERPWGDAYFPEVQKRLAAFRSVFCAGGAATSCAMPTEVHDEAGLRAIAAALTSPAIVKELEARSGAFVHAVQLPNAPRAFNVIGDLHEQSEAETSAFWDMTPRQLQRTTTTPALGDVDSYLEGFEGKDFPAQFAMEGDKLVINDWLLRDRAMTFASSWKFAVGFNRHNPPKDAISRSEDLQFQHLFDDYRGELDATYATLLDKVKGNTDVYARFLKERAAGDYPEEVYQHVAYAHLRNILRLESAYYALAKDQRRTTSPRQQALEALLTLERYEPAWRFFLMELTTRSELFVSRAAVIDQITNPTLAFTFATEQLKAILGLEVYANANLFDHFEYAVMADELFDADYLKEYQPAIYKELLKSDGTLKRVSDLPRADQLRILRSYLLTPDGKVSLTGASRLQAVFGTRIREADLHTLAEVIHQARRKDR